jgi:DNA-binding SARP family transcriptional activator
MRFGVLGALELRSDNKVVAPRGPKVQQVLALLVLQANKLVHIDTLVDELWNERPPRAAVNSLRTHVYHLRGTVRTLCGNTVDPERLISTQPGGYQLEVDPEHIDSQVFGNLVGTAKQHLRDGRFEEGSHQLATALGMWRGQPVANVSTGPILTRHAARLREQRINALQLRIDADLRLGRHHELLGELRDIIGADPYDEWFHARLIDALRRSGRRSEALHVFRALQVQLRDELGVEPSHDAQRAYQAVLGSAA